MCADCWNAAMGLPAFAVAGRFVWVGYRDRVPFLARRDADAREDEVAPADAVEVSDPTADRDDEPVGVA